MNLAKLLLGVIGLIFLVGVLSEVGSGATAFILLLVGVVAYMRLSSRVNMLEKAIQGGVYPSKPSAYSVPIVSQPPMSIVSSSEATMPIPAEPRQSDGYGFGPTAAPLMPSVAPIPPSATLPSM